MINHLKPLFYALDDGVTAMDTYQPGIGGRHAWSAMCHASMLPRPLTAMPLYLEAIAEAIEFLEACVSDTRGRDYLANGLHDCIHSAYKLVCRAVSGFFNTILELSE